MSARALALTEQAAPESDSHAEALRRIGLQAFKRKEFDRAATFFERSIDALESQTTRLGGSNEVRTGFAGQSHDYYVEYIDTLMALDQPARAFEVLERLASPRPPADACRARSRPRRRPVARSGAGHAHSAEREYDRRRSHSRVSTQAGKPRKSIGSDSPA